MKYYEIPSPEFPSDFLTVGLMVHIYVLGVFVGMYGMGHASKLTGVMLFASYLTRPHKLKDYPVPLLTLSGDLDGLTRITRIVDTFE